MNTICFKKLLWLSSLSLGFGALLSACGSVDQYREHLNTSLTGKQIVTQTCSACHGMDGNSVSPQFPKLSGQQKDYLLAQLEDFKGHQRTDATGVQYMWGLSRLTPTQATEVAEYFSKQSPMQGKGVVASANARGEEIFKNGLLDKGVPACSACHGANAEGNGQIPRLSGQHVNYMVKQIEIFQKTEQRPRGVAMKQITHDLSDTDIKAVAEYIGNMTAK